MRNEEEIRKRIERYDKFRKIEEGVKNEETAYHWWICANELRWVLEEKEGHSSERSSISLKDLLPQSPWEGPPTPKFLRKRD